MKLLLGNCLDQMKSLADNSIDSIVTDSPYGLSFMGKAWDYEVPSEEIWREAFRVLKPGGHLLSFFGTRTYHRGVIKIEDAGFEIRDQIMWIYGSGFPKSTDVSKRIDKEAGAEREVTGVAGKSGSIRNSMAGDFAGGEYMSTAPSTDEAKLWQGWGTALKPANEPIVVARKPLEKGLTVAENVLKYGTGAINVDASRIEGIPPSVPQPSFNTTGEIYNMKTGEGRNGQMSNSTQGRWPANIIFDEVTGCAEWSRFFYVAKASKSERNKGLELSELIWEKDTWEKQVQNSLMVDINSLAKVTSEDILKAACKWNTELFGHKSSDQYHLGMTFTTSTALKLIIELKTLNVSQNSNTRENIQDAIKMIEANGLSLAESVECLKKLSQATISEKMELVLGVVSAVLNLLSKIKGYAKSQNFHSTVKPIKLMQYLIKLVTPPNGTILDPFMGSGSTGVAAKSLGFNFVGCEMNEDYMQIAEKRISNGKAP